MGQNIWIKNFVYEKFDEKYGKNILGSKQMFWPKKFHEKNLDEIFLAQKMFILYCGSLTLKCHAILLKRNGVLGFVFIVEERGEERVVFVKINEMALKVLSQNGFEGAISSVNTNSGIRMTYILLKLGLCKLFTD